jgi:hypothetical protein
MNSPEGWSLLIYAAQYGRHLIVEYLVKEGAEIAKALRAAVFTNYPKVGQILIENGAELPDGDYIANVVRNGSIKIVKPFCIVSSTEVVFNKTAVVLLYTGSLVSFLLITQPLFIACSLFLANNLIWKSTNGES